MEFDYQNRPGRRQEKPNCTTAITPKVTIITPYYNSSEHFMETYYCVMNQTMEEFEWIIVDDGSTGDGEWDFLQNLQAGDTRIRVIHRRNGGQSKAKNHAIRESGTDIIVFLDADDLIEPFYVEYLYRALEEYPNAGWSYMDLVGFGAVEYVWCKPFSAGRMTFNNILVNSAAFRKSVLEQAGCFPEIAKHYDEDWALYLKLLSLDIHPVHIPMIGFWYRKSATGMQQTVRRDEELRKISDSYMEKIAKHVNIRIREEIYKGELPECAIKSEYGKADGVISKLCKHRSGIAFIRMLYRTRR